MPDKNTATRLARLMLTLGARPSLELIGVFISGLLFVSVLANWLFALASDGDVWTWQRAWGVFVVLLILFGVAAYLYRRDQSRMIELQPKISETANVTPRRGLIWLLSPGGIDHPALALAYHYGKDAPHTLEFCWLIMLQGDARVQEAKTALEERLDRLGISIQLYPVEVARPDVESTYHAVENIIQHESVIRGLDRNQLIADITGGLKPMTAGMALACLVRDLDAEYVESDRDQQGQVIDGTQRVVQVNVEFASPP